MFDRTYTVVLQDKNDPEKLHTYYHCTPQWFKNFPADHILVSKTLDSKSEIPWVDIILLGGAIAFLIALTLFIS